MKIKQIFAWGHWSIYWGAPASWGFSARIGGVYIDLGLLAIDRYVNLRWDGQRFVATR